MRRLVLTTLLVLGFAGPVLAAPTPEPRVALVIGNSAYQDTPLANPANDARLMAETLRGLGFQVIERIDIDQRAMKLAIFELGDRLEAAGKDAVGLFYYAGHGVQVNGQNYLIPLNARIDKERHVAIEAVGAGWVLSQMEFVGNRMNFVILDACRNNPLTRRFRSRTRGLARMDAPRGSIVAYSTAPGKVARDGEGANSPYTAALAEQMRKPDVPVEQMFKRVRVAVMAETKDEQVPWEASSLTGSFYFTPAKAAATTASPGASTAAALRAEELGAERDFWQSIKDSDDAAMFEAYLAQYPKGAFAGLARLKYDVLTRSTARPTDEVRREAAEESDRAAELAFWGAIKGGNDPADYKAYLEAYPDGQFAALARVRAERKPGPPQVAALSPQPRSFDGDWVLEIVEPTRMPTGIRVKTKIVDNRFFVRYSAGASRGSISGKIDKTGMLIGSGAFAAYAGWRDEILRFSAEYVDGSFHAEFTTAYNNRFRFTLTRVSTQ